MLRAILVATVITYDAVGQETQPAGIWYRSAEGCPTGPEFLERLRSAGVEARLAEAGDRVDFVVTLGASSGMSSGRLEKQTRSGTVAIRQLDGASCEQVAEALALSLALAREPSSYAARARHLTDAAREVDLSGHWLAKSLRGSIRRL
jgi:hypothetical protein